MPDKAARRIAFAIPLACILLAAAPAEAAPEPWPASEWDPRPMDDDLVLPMPCGGAMAFRPVLTPMTGGAMADRQAILGQDEAGLNYKEYLRRAFIAGPFPGRARSDPPRYYIAKYEVTRGQYAAVTDPNCPAAPTPADRGPKNEVSWLDAVTFTVRYSGWLMREARQKLPQRDGATAFVRLPTEDEWEYAARGGAAVSEADFSAATFPMPEGMLRYVWFQGTRSADGRPRHIGTREPNPIGVFDMLGNVAEWVLEPYRLNKAGRPHGMAGGAVARGGDFDTSEGQIRSSLRLELPPFSSQTGQPLTLRTVGFRPVLALVVESSDARVNSYRSAFASESQPQGDPETNPGTLLDRMIGDATEPALRQGLGRVKQAFGEATRERLEQQKQTLQSQLEAVSHIGRQIMMAMNYAELISVFARFQGDFADGQRRLADDQTELAKVTQGNLQQRLQQQSAAARQNEQLLQRLEKTLRGRADEMPKRAEDLANIYLRLVADIRRAATPARAGEEGNVVCQDAQARNLESLPEACRVAVRHASAAATAPALTKERVLHELKAAIPGQGQRR